MLLCGLDVETTGLDPQKDRVIEVGAVLWETDTQLPVVTQSFYVKPDNIDEVWNDDILKISGIHKEHVLQHGLGTATAWLTLDDLVYSSEYIVAHNGTAFDRLFVDAESKRIGEPPWDRPWLDTQNDIEYPESITTRKLMHLAAEHGFLNPFCHRAMFDVLTMFKVLSCYDIQQVIAYSKIPVVTVKAISSFQQKELVKARGYRWDPDGKECGFPKTWWKTIKENKVEKEIAEAPFQVEVVPETLFAK